MRINIMIMMHLKRGWGSTCNDIFVLGWKYNIIELFCCGKVGLYKIKKCLRFS